MLITKNAKPVKFSELKSNIYGETPLPFAPYISLTGQQFVVPQQFLNVNRDLKSVEAILSKITFDDDYLLFVNEIDGGLFLQVGIIGVENYPRNEEQKYQNKIVYGRRWFIEPTTPTSEVIQTAFLAIKKAREHELRENIIFTNDKGIKTTPFNTHMDLPLLVANQESVISNNSNDQLSDKTEITETINTVLKQVTINKHCPSLVAVHQIDDTRVLVDLSLMDTSSNSHFPELEGVTLSIFCEDFTVRTFLHELMNELVKRSDRYIEECFSFDGFNRFSQNVCPLKLAEFSNATRKIHNVDSRFEKHFRQMSYEVDASKAPYFSSGELGKKQRMMIDQSGVQNGYLPLEQGKAADSVKLQLDK